MLSDPQFWVFIAFVIFIIAIFKPVKKLLISNLDTKINEIKNNIEEAEKIKNQAQQTLSEIKKRQNDLETIIKNISIESKEKIILIEKNSNIKLNELIEKRNQIAKIKVEQMTREAKESIKKHVIENTIKTIIEIFENKLKKDEKQKLIYESIHELNSTLKH
tara:strand:+ start:1375 stop:1860 length:486 start_codon:yes stop_codon:yes gene_type:complete